jgi:low affinity Fe/Cu permease
VTDPHDTPHAKRFEHHAQLQEKESAERKESLFLRFCDWTSEVMGEPPNIIFWLILVVGWTLIFALKIVSSNANFLPSWFTGTAYNFPLNLLTTVAELFIGFLVAAAANRAQRILTTIIDGIRTVVDQLDAHTQAHTALLNANSELLQSNTALIQQIHELTKEIHAATAGKSPAG